MAGRQLRMITVGQLRHAGLSASGARSRAARGRLFRVRHGVYSTDPPPYTREQLWMAAVLAGGLGTVLSDWPAAIHLDIALEGFSAKAHITVPSGRGRCDEDIVVHQRPIGPSDWYVKDSIPVTRPELVLVHLSPALTQIDLERMLVAAESLGILDRRRLGELAEERQGRPGIRKLVPLLAKEPAIAKSELEVLMVPVLHEAGVSWPRFNHPLPVPEREEPLIVDLYWPELGMVVELDSQRWHGDWERAEDDRERDQLVSLAGLKPSRFVRRQVKRDPSRTARRLRQLVELRREEVTRLGS